MCQAITASLRATATVATLPPRRAGGARGVPGCFDQHVPCLAGALLADPSVPGRLHTRLAHARVEAEVADQLAGAREAADVADRGEQRGGSDEVDAGQGE